MQTENNSEAETIHLHPGRTLRWKNLRFSLIGSTVPQLPMLASTFVTDGVTTGVTKQAQSGHLIANTIGQLQCYSHDDAKKFNCTFPSNVCTCSTAVNQARCSCSTGKIQDTLTKAPLPIIMKNVMIYQNGKSIEAKSNVGSVLQLHVVTEGLKLISTRQNATCTVIVSDVVGCYHCLNGARTELACHSSEDEVTAEIQCGKHQQIAKCTKNGHINKLTFNFETAIVKETCTLLCPGGLTKFVISGTLEYVNDGLQFSENSAQSHATSCSFSTSSRTASSKVSAIPFEIASYVPSHVCSFQPSSKCDSKKKIGTFNQVELYDGTLLVVPELHIAIKEYLDPEDFVCFDLKGSQQPPKQPYTGTSYFCDKNECHDNAPLFCTFGAPSAIFTTPTGSFVMKAWGITTRTYYGHLPYTSPNVTISITCVKGGAEVTTNLPVDALEACIGNYCLFVTNSTDSQVIFPTSLIAFDYDVDISVWSSGKLIQRKQLHCKAHAVCELMECTFCLEFMYNSHCWTKVQLAMSGIIAISILT
ncbi:hypothetical protein Y032_1011g3388 [Ancylostoma ceylanicum]|uniref:Phlebovirus glycoprotein G2 fusion domain-containing protein n=1 Tax=Ancylostoma ceylanicum TaxID=53326 RepID=A0A016W7N6_9BILA|nr:hypothetical protein Y032_1011g3388 [Ancylostoma ceylanicum]